MYGMRFTALLSFWFALWGGRLPHTPTYAFAEGSIVMSAYYSVPDNACVLSPQLQTTADMYGAWRGPLPPVRVDLQTNTLSAFYPEIKTAVYHTEGVRYQSSRCSFCPYSGPPEGASAEYLLDGGIRYLPAPLYGPCFDGAPSTRESCVQNHLLYPPSFVGEYFYPNQHLDPTIQFPWFYHAFIEGDAPSSITNLRSDSSPKPPSEYGLGRAYILQNLQTFQIINNRTGTVNTTLTAMVQAPYQGTGWSKWGQHFCRAACHRDAVVQQYQVRPSDYAGKPELSFLSRRMPSPTTPGTSEPLTVMRCAACPRFQTAYSWALYYDAARNKQFSNEFASDPRDLFLPTACYPWFGSIPLLAPFFGTTITEPLYILGNVTTVYHSRETDGIITPTSHNEYRGFACPVNTYNDKCAHWFRFWANDVLPVPYQGMPPMQQPQCTPCPPGGWHTDGLEGAWFCLPPPGKTMLIAPSPGDPTSSPLRGLMNMFTDDQNRSRIWARRDILGYEFECGYRPEHCYQCADFPYMVGKRPHEFNEQMILKPLLVWQDCPSRYYCPTALKGPPIPCPPNYPWSPPGSASVHNCTCARGTFRNAAAGGVCTPCPAPRSTCANGQYLAGTTLCTQTNGATSGGVCTPCANAPSGAVYVGGVGIEVLSTAGGGSGSRYAGVCSFDCPQATAIFGDSTCLGTYRCDAVGLVRDSGNRIIYSGLMAGLMDGFRVTPTCFMQRNLSIPLEAAAQLTVSASASVAQQWLLASSTCADADGACAPDGIICAVTRNATYHSNYACGRCPPAPPNGFYDTEGMRASLQYSCRAQCGSGFYFNASSNTCGECAALDRLCTGGNANNSGMHMRGGGCYGDPTPFPTLTDLALLRARNCIYCSITPPPIANLQTYLDIADPDGCKIKPCAASADVFNGLAYIVTLCGGTSNYVTAPCTMSCSTGFYLDGACTQRTTGVCTACTTNKPGYYRTGACSPRADSVWQACGVPPQGGAFVPGFFCPGDGTMQACPNNKTSVAFAKDAGIHCFCPAGTLLSTRNDGTCDPMRCPQDTVRLTTAPGAGWRSAFYMTIDTSAFVSVCRACSSPSSSGAVPAFSVGDGLELASCQCPFNFFALPDSSGTTIRCVACPASASSSSISCAQQQQSSAGTNRYYSAVPNLCWTGRLVGTAECQCLLPPFTRGGPNTILSTQCQPSSGMCADGFLLASDFPSSGGPVPAEPPSGSAMYVPQADSIAGWGCPYNGSLANSFISNYDYTIARMVTTSDYADWGDTYNVQYALWIIADPRSANVYAAPLPPNNLALYNVYHSSDVWTVIPPDYATFCTVEHIAVAQWLSPQTKARLFGIGGVTDRYSTPTETAAVVIDHTLYETGTSLWLYLNTLAVNFLASGSAAWGSGAAARIPITAYLNATPVAIVHSYAPPPATSTFVPPVSAQAGSTFYVAYNVPALPLVGRMVATCEIAAVPTANSGTALIRTARIAPLIPGQDQSVLAMTLLPAPNNDGVFIYLALSTSSNIQFVRWTSSTPFGAVPAGTPPTTVLLPLSADELFFSFSPAAEARAIRHMSMLWPSTSLAPIFFALVEEPVTNAATAQAILYRTTGRPTAVFSADFIQRTMTPVQGMPYPTFPSATTFAVTGTDMGAGLMVASDFANGDVFTLKIAGCISPLSSSPTSSGKPRYWDGGQCVDHACIRARSCNTAQGQVWNARFLRCVCGPGFFVASTSTDTNLVCESCVTFNNVGYFCAGNGTRAACPSTLVSPARATSPSDCYCREGEYFTGTRCASCPAGMWCPNRWDARACPGATDTARSLAGNIYPNGCACNEGNVGAACAACPSGFYCPVNTLSRVVNNAVRLVLAPSSPSAVVGSEQQVCDALSGMLVDYFKVGASSLSYLQDYARAVQRNIFCALLPSPAGRSSIPTMAVIMIQTEPIDYQNSIITSLPSMFRLKRNHTDIAAAGFVIDDVQPSTQPVFFLQVPNNTALLCPTGKAPSAAATTCVCAPGYQQTALICSACKAGEYKPASGTGACLACPVGTTSAVGASACIGTGGRTVSNSTGGSSGDSAINLPLVVGGIAGGVVVVGALVYGLIILAA